jgi:hypothetical protein
MTVCQPSYLGGSIKKNLMNIPVRGGQFLARMGVFYLLSGDLHPKCVILVNLVLQNFDEREFEFLKSLLDTPLYVLIEFQNNEI